MRYVVAVTDIGERDLFQIAKALLQSKVVGQRLAGMLEFAQRVDHRNAGMFCHAFNRLMSERAQHDCTDPALEIVRDVAEILAGIETAVALINEGHRSAEAADSGFKRQAGAQRGFFEEHRDVFPGEGLAEICGTRLHHGGEMEQRLHLDRREVADRDQVASGDDRRLGLRDGLASCEWSGCST